MMNKCNFCEKSSPEGKYWWTIQACRESDCRKAIERMIKAFGKETSNKEK